MIRRLLEILGSRRVASDGTMKPIALAIVFSAGATSAVFAQSNPLYIQFTPAAVKGALYKPDGGQAPHVAVLLIHRTSNFLSHIATAELDPSIHHGTARPRKLLKDDGTVVTQIVGSVRPIGRGSEAQNASFMSGTRLLTARSFLSANAIRAHDSMDDIDWCSSNNSTRCALGVVTIPLLITAMGAHYFIRDNEIHYEVAASADKDFVVIEGATHGIRPCAACESAPGQYSNSVRNFFDYVQRWINARF